MTAPEVRLDRMRPAEIAAAMARARSPGYRLARSSTTPTISPTAPTGSPARASSWPPRNASVASSCRGRT